jgi:hypothetical protein
MDFSSLGWTRGFCVLDAAEQDCQPGRALHQSSALSPGCQSDILVNKQIPRIAGFERPLLRWKISSSGFSQQKLVLMSFICSRIRSFDEQNSTLTPHN